MRGAEFFGAMLSYSFGILAGLVLPRSFDPYLVLVDKLSSYTYIYSVEQDETKRRKRHPEGAWNLWDYFSLTRDYFVVSFARGIVLQTFDLLWKNRLEDFDLAYMVKHNDGYLIEAAICFIVIVAFSEVIYTFFGSNFIAICATLVRVNDSLKIFKLATERQSDVFMYMAKRNLFNGVSTGTTYSLINPIFRGNFEVLDIWIGIRPFYVLLCYLYLNFQETGLHKIHAHLYQNIQPLIANQDFDHIQDNLEDGKRLLTVVVLFTAIYFIAPNVSVFSRIRLK